MPDMISWLKGKVLETSDNIAILDVSGVGYEIICSRQCMSTLMQQPEASVTIYTDVHQDSIRLYGFADKLEKQVFLLLKQVKGMGAKTASEVVSNVDKLELLRIIGSSNLTKLQTIRGIGKKTAERIVVELRDKVGQFAVDRQSNMTIEKHVAVPASEAVDALCALGFTRKEAEAAVRAVNGIERLTDTGEIVREALRFV